MLHTLEVDGRSLAGNHLLRGAVMDLQSADAGPATTREDLDLHGRLRQHLRMPHLRYLDISAANALDQAVRRWPLLAESESIRPLDSALRSPSDDQKPIAQERLA